MPIKSDLSGPPFYDDFNEDKNYHKILFKPDVSVQTRELNQLQTILQNQVERFGDNIYKQGTIIDGCNFSYHRNIPYVKLKDIETDGSRVIVDSYKGYYVKNSANLVATIIDVGSGFESTDNKNTLFVNYLNSGTDLNTYSYSADDVLTVYDPVGRLEDVNVFDGSVGFSNTDQVVILSAIAVTNTTGGQTFTNTFSVGDTITNTIVANAQIVAVDTSTLPGKTVLKLKPLSVDLVNDAANSEYWTFSSGDVFSSNNGQAGLVTDLIGSGANASLVTTGVGSVSTITVNEKGSGYLIAPTVSIYSYTATSGQVNNLELDAQTYFGRVAITAQSTVPVGSGYGVSIDEGVVYQRGFFVKVKPQFLIVERYGLPDGVNVGFKTDEEIINSNIDTDLLDNVLGTANETAPGADRLKLTAKLVALQKSDAESDSEFLSIIEFSGGEPYQQRKQTQYDTIADQMSMRTYDEAGNFVLDEFLLNTASERTFTKEANSFLAVIDPGTAYINGYKVTTDANFELSVSKGLDTITTPVTTSLNYGSYVKLKDVGGPWKFNTGDQVVLYNGQKQYIRLEAGQPVTAPASDPIGKARIRSIIHESGVPGTRTAIYRLYLFEIQLNAGKKLSDVRSIFYDGTYKAVGDILTETDPFTSQTICKLYDSKFSSLVFNNGVKATKSIENDSYIYRTIDLSLTANASGYVVFNTGLNETFPYPSGGLTTSQERDVIVTPLANGVAAANIGGSVNVFSTNTALIGTGTSFITDLTPGDWIKISTTIAQVASVGNNTMATLTSNASANVGSNATIYFPMNVPISLEATNRFANVSASANQMTIFIGTALASDMNVSVVYNVKTAASQIDKSVQRNRTVRLNLANNIAETEGPWALGLPDVFRLNKVYIANGSAVTLSVNSVTAVANNTDFITYQDHTFANGDSVVYTGGTYTIPGLTSNTTYYVYGSNTSGFQLSVNNTTPVSINSSATNDIQHTFTGSPLFFGPNTTGVTEVTNGFYIDHNQTEHYYNTSYLYKAPGSSIPLSNTDVLLVDFDTFSHAADAGLKHIESYNINDSIVLEASNSTINTLELPQFYSTQDVYYDLRDSIDLRPHVIATANSSANTLTSYTINPTEPSADSKFSGTDKKFPAPESSFVGDFEYYQGRYDRIIIDKNGSIKSIKGEAGTLNIAPEPVNSLTINVLKIPPYPSYPISLSSETVKFADTKIANEKYLFKRLQDYRITTSFTEVNIRDEQPKVYRMSDIGTLDRRISDLEYYVALSFAENNIKDKVIPSSIDASLDRFKYGFFVDSFNDATYSDLDSPEYNASIIDGDLVPRYKELNLEFKFNTANSDISALTRGTKFISPPYEEFTLINQPVATDGPVLSVPATPVVSQQLVKVDVVNRTSYYSVNGTVYEDWAFTFSNTAFSPVELFMNCTDNDTAVVVYQSKTPTYVSKTITTTSQYAVPNIANDAVVKRGGKAYLVGGRNRWENDTGFRPGGPSEAGSLWIEDSYKLSWNHNPTNGIYYIIRVYKGAHLVTPSSDQPLGTYAFRIWYPIDGTQSDVQKILTSPNSAQYYGTTVAARESVPVIQNYWSTLPFAFFRN